MLSNDQLKAIELLQDFLSNPSIHIFTLCGSAGTGKTTLISEFITNLNSLTKIVVSAPTNQALEILESKINNPAIKFDTIHSILGYKKIIDSSNNISFKTSKALSIHKFELIIIDECSMITSEIYKKIQSEIKIILSKSLPCPKIILLGDNAQLPPVNDIEHKLPVPDYTLTTILRNNNADVLSICNEIRQKVFNKSYIPNLSKNKGKKVFLYSNKQTWLKHSKQIFEKYNNYSNIILSWTNKSCDEYNNYFKNNNEYNVDDVFVFTKFYSYLGNNFYTSNQIRIIEYTKSPITIKQFTSPHLIMLNDAIERSLITWKLKVIKLLENMGPTPAPFPLEIVVISKESEASLEKSKEFVSNIINALKSSSDERSITKLWEEYNAVFIDPFASINYAKSMTVHRAQGSTFYNVFVDVGNILSNRNINEAWRCLYTSVSRSSNGLFLLLE